MLGIWSKKTLWLCSLLLKECFHVILAGTNDLPEIVDLKFDHVFFTGNLLNSNLKSSFYLYVTFLASMTFLSLDVKEAGKRGAGSLRRRLEPSHPSLLFWGQRTPVMLMNTAKSPLPLSASLGPVSTTPDRVWWLPTTSCATPTSKRASCRL